MKQSAEKNLRRTAQIQSDMRHGQRNTFMSSTTLMSPRPLPSRIPVINISKTRATAGGGEGARLNLFIKAMRPPEDDIRI
jgi:hypothetical protein